MIGISCQYIFGILSYSIFWAGEICFFSAFRRDSVYYSDHNTRRLIFTFYSRHYLIVTSPPEHISSFLSITLRLLFHHSNLLNICFGDRLLQNPRSHSDFFRFLLQMTNFNHSISFHTLYNFPHRWGIRTFQVSTLILSLLHTLLLLYSMSAEYKRPWLSGTSSPLNVSATFESSHPNFYIIMLPAISLCLSFSKYTNWVFYAPNPLSS